MINAKVLYQQGVRAIREQQDLSAGRDLLMRSLRLDPQNVNGWVILAHITDDAAQKRRYLLRALKLDPDHTRAQRMLRALPGGGLDATRQQQIETYSRRAQTLQERGDELGALEQWNAALKIQPDNEDALKAAIKLLMGLDYPNDARTLVMRAIDAGTQNPAIYLTAIDFARLANDADEMDALRQQLMQLPTIDDITIMRVIDDYVQVGRLSEADRLLKTALKRHTRSQQLLVAMGDIQMERGFPTEAVIYYHQAASIDAHSQYGKEADEKLLSHAPVLTDRERGSLILAWREALGVAILFIVLGWQDAGLNLANMGAERWLGVALGLFGGYLLVTATSSPQQMPLARLFSAPPTGVEAGKLVRRENGTLQEVTALPIIPIPARYVIGALGLVMLSVGFALTFSTAIDLLLDPVDPRWQDAYRSLTQWAR